MKITEEWLKEQEACVKGIKWFKNQEERDPIKLIEWFIENEKHLDWANWLIVRIMDYKQYVSYAVYAAEQVLHVYKDKYPNDLIPRKAIKAIKAAKKCIEDPSEKNKAYAAYAAYATYAANDYAVYVANAAGYAANDAAYDAADFADNTLQIKKILQYGLQII